MSANGQAMKSFTSNHLEIKTIDWFKEARARMFENPAELKVEFIEMFASTGATPLNKRPTNLLRGG